ncbi:neuronal acetylcholine receptor subunit alpha-3-like [Diadema antillarum]|uniref:neuronal acetylcholine receptor subunit alpha-3-like n=1 Tax=Diadema antillarum TaxID=105358 RepID=UPI003A892E96
MVSTTGFIKDTVTVSSLDHGKRLLGYLHSRYGSNTIRPAGNLSESVKVSFRNLVVQVIDFVWKDSLLQWNPDDYGGISSVTIDPTLIWTPDITLYENVSPGFITQSADDCLLSSDGTITWFTNVITTSSCPVQVRYFPFDVQVCSLTYSSWIYTKEALDLIYPNDSDSEQDVYFQNGVWSCEVDVENIDVKYTCCPHPYSLVIYTLRLQRLYQHYLVNMVAPGILLSFLNIAVFLIPPESGEKISFAVANLLSAILFQQLISEYMPPLGSQIPLLGENLAILAQPHAVFNDGTDL